jgi:hypothetical protein
MRREVVIDASALTYSDELQLAGAMCSLRSNSHIVRNTLRKWRANSAQEGIGSFEMQVVTAGERDIGSRRPHFRGLGHLVTASFGEANLFVFDIARRKVVATISEEVAADHGFWDRILLPIAMGVLGPAVGVVPVHAACLTFDSEGMLIAGDSGAGKSTLSVALAQNGFGYVSDDWSYLAAHSGHVVAHGMSVPAKLLPDAVKHFPALAHYSLAPALNEELAYELSPGELGAQVQLSCEPQWFFFLERSTELGCRLRPVSADEARRYVERSVERLPPELGEMIHARTAVIDQISRLSCWKLSYGGPPDIAVRGLQNFFAEQRLEVTA